MELLESCVWTLPVHIFAPNPDPRHTSDSTTAWPPHIQTSSIDYLTNIATDRFVLIDWSFLSYLDIDFVALQWFCIIQKHANLIEEQKKQKK